LADIAVAIVRQCRRFNGQDFLRRWKGKKILFVGDSLSLNQWESLACMLHAAAPAAKTTYARGNPISTITFQVRARVPELSLPRAVPCCRIHQHGSLRRYD
jgi:hypothetical protein